MTTRVLFLDDSGKPSPLDTTKTVVIAGFSIPSESVRALDRMIAGAKSRFYPGRGNPGEWQLKAKRTITPDPWKRSKNRHFVTIVTAHPRRPGLQEQNPSHLSEQRFATAVAKPYHRSRLTVRLVGESRMQPTYR